MTQVWMLRNSDTDIHVFNRYEHLKPSVEISYGGCQKVIIQQIERDSYTVMFKVSGERNGEVFADEIRFDCRHVWTEPCHL